MPRVYSGMNGSSGGLGDEVLQYRKIHRSPVFRRGNSLSSIGGRKLRSLSLVLYIALAVVILAPFASAQVDDSLILYMSFDEDPSDGVKDLSNYGNHGEMKSEPEWLEGKFGKALWFDGEDDWVQIPDNETLRVDEAVTVMAWINTETYTFPGSDWQGILAKSNLPRSYSLYTMVGGKLHFSTSGATPQPYYGSVSTATIPLDEWVHVAAVAETSEKGGSHTYYVNGELGGEKSLPDFKTLPGDQDTSDVFIARKAVVQPFLGFIDEVRIWNRALSADEVKAQMNKGQEAFFAVQPQSGLAATWGGIKSKY